MDEAGVRTMAIGDVVGLTFTDYYQTGGGNSAKDFTAEYKPAAPSTQADTDTDAAPF